MKFTMYNGSPRGLKSNSQKVVDILAECFDNSIEVEKYYIKNIDKHDEVITPEADAYFFAFPLYVDIAPYPVKVFFEKMEENKHLYQDKPIYFFIHSGFPEAKQSRLLERYIKYFCTLIGAKCMGIAIMGNSEALRYLNDDSKRVNKIKENMKGLANNISANQSFNDDNLEYFKKFETLPKAALLILKIFPKLFNKMFDMMIKKNGAYDKRFNRPYA